MRGYTKYKIVSKEDSEITQNRLFKEGYKWRDSSTNVKDVSDYIFTDDIKKIIHYSILDCNLGSRVHKYYCNVYKSWSEHGEVTPTSKDYLKKLNGETNEDLFDRLKGSVSLYFAELVSEFCGFEGFDYNMSCCVIDNIKFLFPEKYEEIINELENNKNSTENLYRKLNITLNNMKCKDCSVEMEVGKFIKGSDMSNERICFGDNTIKDVVELEDCYKCPECGRSEII